MTFRGLIAALVISIVVAGATYVVGRSLPATFTSSGTFRVTVASQQGISDPVVLGANDLSAQYAQVANSEAVQALAARALSVSPATLSFTGSTVAAQDVVQVTATAPTASQAEARARAGTAALRQYLDGLNAQQSAQYAADVEQSVQRVNRQIVSLEGALAKDSIPQHSVDEQLVVSLSNQRAQLLGEIGRDTASNRPSLQALSSATSATESTPKPRLYALVAFLVSLLITLRLAVYVTRGRLRRRDPTPLPE